MAAPESTSADSIYQASLGHAPVDSDAVAKETPSDDAALQREVRDLLDAAGAEIPPSADLELEAELARLKPEEEGDRIDGYKLREQLGEGGFGTVWLAEQEEPVRRRVALKILKLGMDTKEVVARFEQERQALALMDHPNIAQVYDAGATPTGRPYIVMELVRGVPITEYCDEQNLSMRARIELFVDVCQAVQHAHQKGIIHRDLKPSNILVTCHDGAPLPKVIDFGVAKAAQGRLTEQTVYTQFQQMLGTPLYMSPEQAELTSLDIDTRTDIYSLGVLLYELLTGRTPIDPETMRRAGFDEMRRVIREVEPTRPSMRVKTLDVPTVTVTAKRRNVLPAKLPSLLRGDLDWVVMKALEKDRNRRYEAAISFARDLQRYLRQEPVSARPPSVRYRAGKFVRKHRVPVLAFATVAFAVVAGLAASTFLYLREKTALAAADEARRKAELSEHRALAEAARSARTATFMAAVLRGIDPAAAKNADTTLVKQMLDRASVRLGREFKDQPQLEAQLRQTLGGAYTALGLTEQASLEFTLAQRVPITNPGDERLDSLGTLKKVATQYWEENRYLEAETLCRQALEISLRLNGPEHEASLEAMDTLAWVLSKRGNIPEARALEHKLLEVHERTLGPEHVRTLADAHQLGFLYIQPPRDLALAETYDRRAYEGEKKLLGANHDTTLSALWNLAWALTVAKKYPEAETHYLALYEAVKDTDTLRAVEGETVVHSCLHDLALIYEAMGKPEEAAKWQARLAAYDAKAASQKGD
jgi:serine/threonine protein kinase